MPALPDGRGSVPVRSHDREGVVGVLCADRSLRSRSHDRKGVVGALRADRSLRSRLCDVERKGSC